MQSIKPIDPYLDDLYWDETGQLKCLCRNNSGKIGYLNWSVSADSLEIRDLYIINEKYRQCGIGSMLIEEILKLSKANKIYKIWGVTQWNDFPVHDFYRKHGFSLETEPVNGSLKFYKHI